MRRFFNAIRALSWAESLWTLARYVIALPWFGIFAWPLVSWLDWQAVAVIGVCLVAGFSALALTAMDLVRQARHRDQHRAARAIANIDDYRFRRIEDQLKGLGDDDDA